MMLRLKIVKSVDSADEAGREEDQDSGLIHGCVVLKELVQPWFNSGRIVCADSYFASVSTAKEMLRLGLRFIGVVKTATKQFPMEYLSHLELATRGLWKGVVHRQDGQDVLYAFVWVDRDRRFFITNTLSLAAGRPYTRRRMRQVQPVETDLPPEDVELTIAQPLASEVYYGVCGKIDQHNRRRHDDLQFEKKIEVKSWDKRVNLSILAIIVVDAFFVYTALVCNESEKDFWNYLAEELIDNSYDVVNPRRRQRNSVESPELLHANGTPRAGVSHHLSPTKTKQRRKPTFSAQRQCKICKMKTTTTCSSCQMYVCNSKSGRTCFARHMAEAHSSSIN